MRLRHLLVRPDLPDELEILQIIGMNLWFTWNPDVTRLFQALDQDLWEETGHNPILLLANLSEQRKREIVQDIVLMDRIKEAERAFDQYIMDAGEYSFKLERPIDYRIAYFSMEYGLSRTDTLIRPWLQHYWYDRYEIAEQRRAAEEASDVGWCYWNAGGQYDELFFVPPQGLEP